MTFWSMTTHQWILIQLLQLWVAEQAQPYTVSDDLGNVSFPRLAFLRV